MKVLLATCRYPWPPRRGDQIRTVQLVESLGPEHDVTLLTPNPPAGAPAPPRSLPATIRTYRALAFARVVGVLRAALSGWPLQCGLFQQPALAASLRELAPQADRVVLQLVRLGGHEKDLGATPLVVDFIDSLSLNFQRRAVYDRRWLRPLLKLEGARLGRLEASLAARANHSVVVSMRDREAMAARWSSAASSRLTVVPLSMPIPAAGQATPVSGKPSLVFTGNLGYFVNADALRWWLEAVWPPLREAGRVQLLVAGERASANLRRRLRRASAKLVDGPPELRPILEQATVALAPMRCGSGVPIKVLEAWAAGVPVVASPWAAAGTSGVPGEDLLVAESPEEWWEAVERVIEDRNLANRIVASARARLALDYSTDAVARSWRRILGETPVARRKEDGAWATGSGILPPEP